MPAKMDFPVEIWMRIFEHMHSENIARPPAIAKYAASLSIHGDSIQAAQTLPKFEQECWIQTRPLYAINQTSRAAAIKLRLCLHVLRTCRKPLLASQCLDEWDAQSWRTLPDPGSVTGCVAVQLYGEDGDESLQAEYREQRACHRLLTEYVTARTHYLRLETAKRVVLFVDDKRCAQRQIEMADGVKCKIERFWREERTENGRVEIVPWESRAVVLFAAPAAD